MLNPDGTATLYTYQSDTVNGTETTITSAGVPDASLSAITDGTRTTVTVDSGGNEISRIVEDIATGLRLSKSERVAADEFGRPTVVKYDDDAGMVETFTPASCCGIEAMTDKAGVATHYDYDSSHRRILERRGGVELITGYDAEGRVSSKKRKGVAEALGAATLLSTTRYDLAGRLVETTEPAANDAGARRTTTFAEATVAGQRVRTTTLPGGGTRVETYFQDGRLAKVTGAAAAPMRYEYGVEDVVQGAATVRCTFTKETRLDALGADTAEWMKSDTDIAGRTIRVSRPREVSVGGVSVAESFYNAKGQLVKTVDPDGVTVLFEYNAKGEGTRQVLDMNRNGVVDAAGGDRIAETTRLVATNGAGAVVLRSTTKQWETDGVDTGTVAMIEEATPNGMRQWNTRYGLTTTVQAAYAAVPDGTVTTTVTFPDGTSQVEASEQGRRVSVTRKDNAGVVVTGQTFGYDAQGRLVQSVDLRSGATDTTYYGDDRLATVKTPAPDDAGPQVRQTTSYTYHANGQQETVTQADGGVMHYEYGLTGALAKQYGERTYPVEYGYDAQGRLKTLKTWQDYGTGTGGAMTTWVYDGASGRLLQKQDAAGLGATYAYTAAGRLASRAWARSGAGASYGYNNAGEQVLTDYADATPDVTLTYDRLGRVKGVTDGTGARTVSYTAAGGVDTESWAAWCGVGGVNLQASYDAFQRRNGLGITGPLGALEGTGFGYDSAGRLQSVTQGAVAATYGYEPGTANLVKTITTRNAGQLVLTRTQTSDKLGRFVGVANVRAVAPTAGQTLGYGYNSANQRVKATREDGSWWDYGYDALGQVTSGARKWSDGAAVAGEQFGYAYDDIGNRKSETTNGRTSNYATNSINEYTSRTVPGAVDVFGTATSGVNVRIASQHLPPESAVGSAQEFFSYYSGLSHATTQKTVGAETFFYGAETVDNSAAGVKKDMLIVGVKPGAGPGNAAAVRVETKSVFLPKTPELSTYDIDGNQTSDGLWQYRWDAENRLIEMETSASAVTAGMPKQKLTYTYDAQSRRVSKQLWSWVANSYTLTATTRFLYDGWNLVAELSATGTLQRRHTWGLDLSGSEQGAGGVAGLLITQTPTTAHLPTYDGNGNVLTLINATTGAIEATYEYTPFGAPLRATGVAAKANPFRFSTKYCDEETGNYYYGYRYYKTLEARWLNKDPIGERGGVNLMAFVQNSPVNLIDVLGYWAYLYCERCKNDSIHSGGPKTGQMHCLLFEGSGKRPRYHPSSWQMNASGFDSTLVAVFDTNLTDPETIGKWQATNGRNNWTSITPNDPYGRYGPVPPRIYDVLPKTDGPAVNEQDDNGHINFHKGTPSVTDPGRSAGHITTPKGTPRGDLRIHMPGYSQGCLTCEDDHEWTVEDIMNRHSKNGGLKVEIKEVDCCSKKKGTW